MAPWEVAGQLADSASVKAAALTVNTAPLLSQMCLAEEGEEDMELEAEEEEGGGTESLSGTGEPGSMSPLSVGGESPAVTMMSSPEAELEAPGRGPIDPAADPAAVATSS